MLITYTEMVQMHSKITPIEIETTLRDMKQHKLENCSEYEKLKSYIEKIRNLNSETTFEALRGNVFEIIEAYHYLLLCNHIVLQRQIDKVFSKYIEL